MGEELNGTLHLLWEDGTLVPFTGIGEIAQSIAYFLCADTENFPQVLCEFALGVSK